MKKSSFLAGVLTATTAILLFLLLVGNSPQDTTSNDRYQLFSGEYNQVIVGFSDEVVPGVFKLDKQTGQAWFYYDAYREEGGLVQRWSLIDN